MRRSVSILALAALAAACAGASDSADDGDALRNAGVAMDIDTFAAENMQAPANTVTVAEPGPDDARTVVTGYFDALDDRRYADAYALWEPGAAGMDARAFAASFAKYESYTAEIGVPGRIDTGAGQRYVRVPVRVAAVLADGGEPVTLIGPVTLHRTGLIDGSTMAQRGWRIRDTALKPRPLSPPADRSVAYHCDDGSSLDVRFDTAADTATLAVTGEEPVVLAGQRPASGIWYAGDGWELRGKGDTATLMRPGAGASSCSVAADIPSGGAGEGAQGDEPR